MRCPVCDKKQKVMSKNNGFDTLLYCGNCGKGFKVSIKPHIFPTCYKCGKQILPNRIAVEMGNGKFKHERCRRTICMKMG